MGRRSGAISENSDGVQKARKLLVTDKTIITLRIEKAGSDSSSLFLGL